MTPKKRNQTYKRKSISLLLIGLILTLLIGCETSDHGASESVSNNEDYSEIESYTDTKSTDQSDGSFELTMLDVGQGLCILLEADGEYMIYDGGGRSRSSYVVAYLKKQGITDIKYLFASHYDEDHIAGLIGVLNTVSVEKAVVPDYVTDTEIYASFIDAAHSAMTMKYAKTDDKYELGNAVIYILYAADGSEEQENNMSTVVKVCYRDFSCVISGDAETEVENILVGNRDDLSCDLYIVGHHGSSSSSSKEFVTAMQSKLAFISVGTDNNYNHPTEKTLQTLNEANVSVYRTDIQGVVKLNYYKDAYEITTETDYLTDAVTAAEMEEKEEKSDQSYVINHSSKKFHYPECDSVRKMSVYNKEYTHTGRDELIEQGYAPCGVCNP